MGPQDGPTLTPATLSPDPILLQENSQVSQVPILIPQDPKVKGEKFMILRQITPPPFRHQVKLPGSSDLMQLTFGKGYLNHFFIHNHKKFDGRNNLGMAEEPPKEWIDVTSDQTEKLFKCKIPKT